MDIQVLHIDDDPFELERIKKALHSSEFEFTFDVQSVLNSKDYMDHLSKGKIQVAILDIHLNEDEIDGLGLATKTRKKYPNIVIIMRSNLDDPMTIIKCLKAGADDFISKDSDKGELCLRVANSFKLAQLKHGYAGATEKGKMPADVVGNSFENIWSRIPRVIDSAVSSIVVRGPSGTGKEVVAKLFSSTLGREVPFVSVNCGSISPSLLESELFGYMKGAFTGANKDKKGYVEQANGGWLFLDEVATLSGSAQVALLRVLESGEIIPVGASQAKKVFVRFIAATNENIEELIEEGKFRLDLWQRLQEATIFLKPLSERLNEIPELVDVFCKNMGGGPYKITKVAKDLLVSYDWNQGNVRELRNCLRAMTELHQDKTLTPLAIPDNILEQLDQSSQNGSSDSAAELINGPAGVKKLTTVVDFSATFQFDDLVEELMIQVIQGFLKKDPKLSLRSLSQQIGISRSTLSSRIKEIIRKGKPGAEEIERAFNFS